MSDSAERDDPDGLPLWQLVVAVGLAVLLLVGGSLVAWLLFSDEEETFDAGPGVTTVPSDEPGVHDDFDRDGERSLGRSTSGQEWAAVSGTWGIDDGRAVVTRPNPDGPRSVAVVDMGAADGSLSVQASTLAQGWGLVFRYRGSFNYWMLVASPEYATFNVQKVVDGAVVSIGTLGLVSTADGTTIRVDLHGTSFDVFVDGDLAGTFEDPHLQSATQVGLVAQGPAAEIGRWDDFDAMPTAAAVPVTVPTPTRPAGAVPTPTSVPAAAPATAGAPG